MIVLMNGKFDWSDEEIERAISLFSLGLKPSQVAEIMNQKVIDIGILYLHLLDKKKINFQK
ncbi:hypothetical protein [Enterococcus pallens]|uniref:hypothetical protein n=1 Tax=Enterococcus pallens TaxID=160454 RepID=UPI0003A92F8D|nr:hypothetical protein [Enterococcus pallens]